MHHGHGQSFPDLLSSKRFLVKQHRRIQVKPILLSTGPLLQDDGGLPKPSQLGGSPPSQLKRRVIVCLILLKNIFQD